MSLASQPQFANPLAVASKPLISITATAALLCLSVVKKSPSPPWSICFRSDRDPVRGANCNKVQFKAQT
eukprot:scaffold60860_cov30-Cyclotella_meneghiniana.AAC.1